jgi:hypothetical protein
MLRRKIILQSSQQQKSPIAYAPLVLIGEENKIENTFYCIIKFPKKNNGVIAASFAAIAILQRWMCKMPH